MDYSFGLWVKRKRKALDLTQQELAQRVSSKLRKVNVMVSRLGAALGVHGGPGTLFVALRGNQTTL